MGGTAVVLVTQIPTLTSFVEWLSVPSVKNGVNVSSKVTMMSTSYSGYTVNPDLSAIGSTRQVPDSNVRLSVRYGSPGSLLIYVAEQFDKRVEDIDQAYGHPVDDGGYNYRSVGGSTSWSNHASATAIDLNWNKHPRGSRNTFTQTQVAEIRKILAELQGAIYWGGDYRSPSIVDEMHWEIVKGANTDWIWAQIQASHQTPKKERHDFMINRQLKDGFAFDASGDNRLDPRLVTHVGHEWSNSSGSIPSLGKGTVTFGGPYSYSVDGVRKGVKLRVEFDVRDASGGEWHPRARDIVICGEGQLTDDWLAIPNGAYGISVGRVDTGEPASASWPIDFTLTWDVK